ncbi:MAG TPA: DUF1295 domain-containing protein [Allocoleopsis sp.]
MENATNLSSSNMTQLTAINIAKALTSILLIAAAFIWGINDFRQVIYLCLHIGYCSWWLIEQWFFPERSKQIFSEKVGGIEFIFVLLFVGILYALPGYFAFTNPEPISYITVAIALPLYTFGTLINTSADVQKMTAKQYNSGLVKDNIWRLSRNINYFGDILRYLSFSIVAGSIYAYSVPGLILILYIQRMLQKEKTMLEKYPDYGEYLQKTSRFIPFIW